MALEHTAIIALLLAFFVLSCASLLLGVVVLLGRRDFPDWSEVKQFVQSLDYRPKPLRATPAKPPQAFEPAPWLRVPPWVVKWLDRVTRREGRLAEMNSRKLAALYVTKTSVFVIVLAATPLLTAIAARAAGLTRGFEVGVVLLVAMAALGFLSAYALHKGLVKAARARLASALANLPYFADFVALVLDAGSNFEDGIVGFLSYAPESPLREEMHVLLQELRAGATYEEAFTRLAARNPIREIERITVAIAQGTRTGTPLSAVFLEQSELLRMERLQRATMVAERMAIDAAFPLAGVVAALTIILVAPFVMAAIPELSRMFH